MNELEKLIWEDVIKELKDSAHDQEHVIRVYKMCHRLAENEFKINLEVLSLAALLHDIARVIEDNDETRQTDHTILGAEMSETILKKHGVPDEVINAVLHCIVTHRFRGTNKPESLEAKILFDADKLDILGAIGIARSFRISGEHGEPLYRDVNIPEYIKENFIGGTTSGRIIDFKKHAPNLEFETKIKQISGRMYTDQARKAALKKIEFMDFFYSKLRAELKGELNEQT